MLYEHRRADVAVFIDFENVYVSVRDKLDANPNFEAIMDRCNDLGRVVIARAYADWYRYPRITSALYANSIEPMYVPTYYYDKDMGRTGRAIKNSVDMNLCIDVMKTLYTNSNISKFVLATGDRDFIPLVNSVRQQGKEVIVIGIGGAASTHLAQSADEFIFYEQLIGRTPAPSRPTSNGRRGHTTPVTVETPAAATPPTAPTNQEPSTDIYDVLIDAIHLVRERGYVSTLGSIKLVMKELMGGEFKESRYRDMNGRPFGKFKDFVVDAERRGKVQIFTSGTVNEVFLPGEDPLKLSQFADAIPINKDDSSDETEATDTNGHRSDTTTDSDSTNGTASSSRSRRRRRPRRSRRDDAQEKPLEGNDTDTTEQPDDLADDVDLAGAAAHGEYGTAPDRDPADDTSDLPDRDPADDTPDYTPIVADDTDHPRTAAPSAEHGATSAVEDRDDVTAPPVTADALPPAYDPYTLSAELLAAQDSSAYDAAVDAAQHHPDDSDGSRSRFEDLAAQVQTTPRPQQPFLDVFGVAPSDDDTDQRNGDSDITFEDDEWVTFTHMMQGFSKPVSFSQMLEKMKQLRNEQQFIRTNEQLRTMAKQAINSGKLERSGRGSRVYYALKPAPDTDATATAAPNEPNETDVVPTLDTPNPTDTDTGFAPPDTNATATAAPNEPNEPNETDVVPTLDTPDPTDTGFTPPDTDATATAAPNEPNEPNETDVVPTLDTPDPTDTDTGFTDDHAPTDS